jgi:hypothetical protein
VNYRQHDGSQKKWDMNELPDKHTQARISSEIPRLVQRVLVSGTASHYLQPSILAAEAGRLAA